MNKLIIVCVVLTAFAGAEPPRYRSRTYQQQQEAPYAPAGAPSGQLLVVPGEYVVQVQSPYSQYVLPGQYNEAVAPVAPIQEYGAPVVSGQLQLAPRNQEPQSFRPAFQPGVQQPQQSQFGRLQAQPAQQQQYNNQDDAESKKSNEKPYNQRGNVKFTSSSNNFNNNDQSSENQYQQGRYATQPQQPNRGNNRYTSPKDQVEYYTENKKQYNQPNEFQQGDFDNNGGDDAGSYEDSDKEQVQDRYQQQPAFGKYTQQSFANQYSGQYNQPNQPQIQTQYSNVNKYTPPRKYIPSSNGKTTTEYPYTSTEYYDASTTEVATTTAQNNNQKLGGGQLKDYYKNGQQYNQDAESFQPNNGNTKESQGFYHLLLPDGKLQKIIYMTAEDLEKMAFVARLQYQNIEPIRGPVYTYDPKKSPFVQVF